MLRRLAMAGVAVGALIAAGVLLANVGLIAAGALLANVGPTATLSTGRSSSSMAALLLANRAGSTTPGTSSRFGWGFGGRRGHVGFGRVLAVRGVSGNTITATGRGGQTVTVQVSATTAYTEAGTSASLADIHPGSFIAVRGSVAGTSATTINATSVTILLSREAGVVTNVAGDTITLTGFDGASHTISVTGQTRYQKAGASAGLSDLTTGTAIVAAGTLDSNGTLTAVRIMIRVPRVGGEVTAVNGSSYTVTARFGTTYAVNATSSTTYVNLDGTATSASAVKVGTYIAAQGTLSADGKTLTAQRILVAPAGTGRGFGFGFRRHRFDRGGPGFGQGNAGAGSAGTTAPTTAATQNV
jgi:Domain of unknown function (DUF5666)